MQIGMKTRDGIQKRYGTRYDVGSISEVLCIYLMFLNINLIYFCEIHKLYTYILIDLASGTSIDWIYSTQNVPLAYTFEFRDSRNGEFEIF